MNPQKLLDSSCLIHALHRFWKGGGLGRKSHNLSGNSNSSMIDYVRMFKKVKGRGQERHEDRAKFGSNIKLDSYG
jgi:hypothetical protein